MKGFIKFPMRYFFNASKINTVKLESEYIPSKNSTYIDKHMILLHGLLGHGKNWHAIANDPRVMFCLTYRLI